MQRGTTPPAIRRGQAVEAGQTPIIKCRKKSDHSDMNATIRNIPDAVYQRLKQTARGQRRSLNGLIVQVLTREASELKHRRRMRASRKQLEKFVASLPKLASSAKLIREDRGR
jgi:hypothetical protein